MSKKKSVHLSSYEKGEQSRKKIPYNQWGNQRDILLKKDLNSIFQEFILLRKIETLEVLSSIQLFYRINLITGEKIEFTFSFLKRISSDMFIERTNSQNLNIIINGDLVNYNNLYKKINEEIHARMRGYETESLAFDVVDSEVQKGSSMIRSVRKSNKNEDKFLHSDLIIEWENGENFGVDIKTSKKHFELALKKREYKFSKYGNPVLTYIKELKTNPSKFIQKIEWIGKKVFEHK